MADLEVTQSAHATLTGTTADRVIFTRSYRSVRVTNLDTTDPLYVTVASKRGSSYPPAPVTAVAEADGTQVVAPETTVEVFASSRGRIVGLSIVGDGNAYVAEGRNVTLAAGSVGAVGPTGPTGPPGADGADGVGVPAGGAINDVLAKASADDFDTAWVNPNP